MICIRFILIFTAFLVVSCKNNEDPQSFLNGTYETAQKIQGRESWYVNQFKFQTDGSFEQTSYWRENEVGERIGFTYYSKGNYTLNGIEFTLLETQIKERGFDEPLVPVIDFNDLPKRGLLPEGLESRGILKVLNRGSSFSLRMGCNAESGICLNLNTTLIYNRID